MDNARLISTNLLSYIDLGNGILSNSTLNLHGSALLEQAAHHAADAVSSPLQHNHNCHHRQTTTTMSTEGEDHHDHGKRRRRRDSGHDHHMEMREQQEECEPHKLLDEWIRASRNRFGTNETFPIVQPIDADSIAGIFQLQYGIPSILIEMTQEQVRIALIVFVRSENDVDSNLEFCLVRHQFLLGKIIGKIFAILIL